MPMKKGTSKENCISINYKEMIRSGREKKVAQAAALNHCGKIYGGIPKKKDKKKERSNLIFIKADIDLELEDIKTQEAFLAKAKELIQESKSSKIKRSSFTGQKIKRSDL